MDGDKVIQGGDMLMVKGTHVGEKSGRADLQLGRGEGWVGTRNRR